MICLLAVSVALTGYMACLIASHIHGNVGWVSAPAVLPGLSFGLAMAGLLLQRGWISRGKAVGLVVGSAVAYFAAYWSAFHTILLCGKGMILSSLRLSLFHAGMIGGLVGTALLIASLAAVLPDFRRKEWKGLFLVGIAAGGALCLAGIGATSDNNAGTLANPGDRTFIFIWQLLVSGYVGMLLLAVPGSAKATEPGRIAHWAKRAVFALLVVSFVQAAIGYSRRDKESRVALSATSRNSNAQPSTHGGGDASAWANNYRNAKFLTRAEFLNRVGPVHLTIRPSADLNQCVHDVDGIVKGSVAAHGFTLASAATDIELIVDGNIDRSKITTITATQWGQRESGYKMAYVVTVQIGFLVKANCHRGDSFVQLPVFPCRNWSASMNGIGELVDFEADYTDAFHQVMDNCLQTMREYTDADDIDDQTAAMGNLWPSGQDGEMQKKFYSPKQAEAGGAIPVFNNLNKFALRPTEFLGDAEKGFNRTSIEQDWMNELRRNSYEVDPSAAAIIRHAISTSWQTLSALPSLLRGPGGGPGVYIDMNAVSAWQKNVVFEFNGELRRAKAVCIWDDLATEIALPEDQNNTARKLVNQSIRSAAKEFALRR